MFILPIQRFRSSKNFQFILLLLLSRLLCRHISRFSRNNNNNKMQVDLYEYANKYRSSGPGGPGGPLSTHKLHLAWFSRVINNLLGQAESQLAAY